MDKIIIHHGERATEHELGAATLVIGRDPECDLFFADKKLSRRHARIERAGRHVRLVDLGSRNGSWVNEERVEERDLVPGDEIRLGGLHIRFESEPERAAQEAEGDQSTVFLTAAPTSLESEPEPWPAPEPEPEPGTVVLSRDELEPPGDDSHTVMLAETPAVGMSFGDGRDEGGDEADEVSPATVDGRTSAAADDSATVFLSAAGSAPATTTPPLAEEGAELDELDETLQKPEPDRTVVLESRTPPQRERYDTGQVLFRQQADPRHQHAPSDESTKLVQPPAAEGPSGPLYDRSEPSLTASVTFVPEVGFARRSWSTRFGVTIGGLVLFALFVIAFPLVRILRPALVEESRSRARALVELLAATNEDALGEDRLSDLSVSRVADAPGVTAAFILSPAGAILAPSRRSGEALSLQGLGEGSLADVRNFRSGTGPDGELVVAQPVTYEGKRVGVAVLTQSAPAATGGATTALVVGVVLLLMGAAVVFLLGRKMTIEPLDELRRDVEAFADGTAPTIPVERAYGELSLLAVSLNRLVGRRAPGAGQPED